MNSYYLDTSALVKHYVDEVGSDWIHSLIKSTPRPLLIVSHLVSVEVFSALARRLRKGSLITADYERTKIAFRRDYLSRYQIVIVTVSIVDTAYGLLDRHALRAYDATHLAVALEANRSLVTRGHAALEFLSADDRLNQAASAEGLMVDNPNHYP
ncbi:MAG: type II toxin-antitoxin system VapC family toxin [Chloroflexota bacterium]|nr:type II toxin-antitoxin system VapC family toxin [Chloroflexota bacterium]